MLQFGLKTRLLLLTIIPTLTISALLSTYFIQLRTGELEQDLEIKGFSIIDQFTPMLFDKLEQLNQLESQVQNSSHTHRKNELHNQLQSIGNRIIEAPDVRSVTVFNPKGKSLAHAGPTMRPPINSSNSRYNRNNSNSSVDSNRHSDEPPIEPGLFYTPETLRFKSPITSPVPTTTSDQTLTTPNASTDHQQPIGWIEVELSSVNIKLAKYQLYLTTLVVIILAFIINAFFGLRLSRNITEPLSEIITAVNRVKDGHLDTRVHTHAGGELHDLELGINSMVESLKIAHEELKQSVDQATEDLRETLETIEIQNIELDLARKEALEASRIKSEFLANMSHEIRTPLNGIIGFTKLLLKTQITAHQLDYLGTINKSSESLLAIINDILDFSKIEAGKLTLDYIPISLRNVVEEVTTMVAPLAHEKQLELVSLVYNNVPANLVGDPLRLKQIITNLVNNAIKFTESGNIVLRTMLESQEDKFAVCKISITDTGIGLSEEDQSVIFKAFNQADTSAARRFGGTGLGLVISKYLVEQMGGEIGLKSEPGKGSTFWFKVRLDINPQREEPTASPLTGKRIAVFDENPVVRLSVRHMLENWHVSSIGEIERIEEIHSHIAHADSRHQPYNAIIIGLPPNKSMSQHLMQTLETLHHQFNCPSVILANTNDWPLQTDANELTWQWISKPVRSSQLYDLLNRLVSDGEHPTNTLTNVSLTPPLESPLITQVPRILCVDDNAANLKLIRVLLEDLGISVTACESGLQALDHMETECFDLIFMDIQMPIMDGVETTRRIREREAHQEAQTTIVALTAHALASEKEELLRAGMNDYVTKPINETLLIETIFKWTGFRAHPLPTQKTTPHLSHLPSTVISAPMQHSVIDLDEGLRLSNGKIDLADDMLRMLLDSLPKEHDRCTEAWENEDLDSLLEHVHKLHGATRYCGTPALRSVTAQLETRLKSTLAGKRPQADIIPAFKQLIIEMNRLQHWGQQQAAQPASLHASSTTAPLLD